MSWKDNIAGNEHVLETTHSFHFFKSVVNTDVLQNSLFKDLADDKLKYKDGAGTIHLLY
jgi:hypothetical protein